MNIKVAIMVMFFVGHILNADVNDKNVPENEAVATALKRTYSKEFMDVQEGLLKIRDLRKKLSERDKVIVERRLYDLLKVNYENSPKSNATGDVKFGPINVTAAIILGQYSGYGEWYLIGDDDAVAVFKKWYDKRSDKKKVR